jgi:hypothetical protein
MSDEKWRMVRHEKSSDYGVGAYTLWPQGVIIKPGLSEQDAATIEVAQDAIAVLREFCTDVKAAGVRSTMQEWPDVYETWRHARTILRQQAVAQPKLERSSDGAKANTSLIAAAKVMLQALESVAQAYQEFFDVMPVAWQTFDDIVTAAIARAKETGELY